MTVDPSAGDRQAREFIRTVLDRSVIVEAAAGTGKTTALVGRIVSVLAQGVGSVDSIVAVTFTDRAAGELKLRLRSALDAARSDAGDSGARRACLEQALARLEEARIGTIHSFCAEILREHPVEAGVDPRFATMTDAEGEELYRREFGAWVEGVLEDPPEGVRRSLRRPSGEGFSGGPLARLRRAGWDLSTWRDFPAAWRRDRFARGERIDRLVPLVSAFAALTGQCGNPANRLFRDTEPARQFAERVQGAETVRERDYDRVEGLLVALSSDGRFRRPIARPGRTFAPGVTEAQVLAAHGELLGELTDFARAADADLAALLQRELQPAVARYESAKRREGRLDFLDLLLRARDLVRDRREIRAALQQRFTHFFVDEFQDTDPVQAELLVLLSADDPAVSDWREARAAPGKLFLVGDPKQSIYRFRRADVGLYRDVCDRLERGGGVKVRLSNSYRSVPSIQRFVNAAFAPLMTGAEEGGQAEYAPLDPCRDDVGGRPSVVALPVPEPYGGTGVSLRAIEQSLPDAVAGFVSWLLNDSGWTVTEREAPGEAVPLAPRHVCLLFRRFEKYGEDVTRRYVQALEARGVPHLLVGGRSFHRREEVQTIVTALAAVEDPEDELAVFATLHGSLFAVGDEELLAYRRTVGSLAPVRGPAAPLADERLAPVAQVLELLCKLHRRRNQVPASETVAALLEASAAHAGFVLRPSGEQVLANVMHLLELARVHESGGGISFRGFVERLRDDVERADTAEAPILEEGAEGVRIMTVHKAKGLEFPVVVGADIGAALFRDRPARHIDAARGLCAVRLAGWAPAEVLEHAAQESACDRAEGIRVAYVAATRARDILVVAALGDGPLRNGWLSPLNGALYPEAGRWGEALPAPGCPAFGGDSVLTRPPELWMAEHVRPGRHGMPAGGPRAAFDVVWWDPRALRLQATPLYGIRQRELLSPDPAGEQVAAGFDSFRRWEAQRARALEAGARPSLAARTVTGELPHDGPEPGEVEVIEIAPPGAAAGGARYGSLVHAVLGTVPFDSGDTAVREIAARQGRLLGASEDEIGAAATAVLAALAHDLLRRAAAAESSGQCRRECPLRAAREDGGVLEGVVDLAFADGAGWTVVEFKTGYERKTMAASHLRQVGAYARIVAACVGRPTRAVLAYL